MATWDYTGTPYKWTGFDTPERVNKKITEGLGLGAHSWHQTPGENINWATGIDCSGFVTRMWFPDRDDDWEKLGSCGSKDECMKDIPKEKRWKGLTDYSYRVPGWDAAFNDALNKPEDWGQSLTIHYF